MDCSCVRSSASRDSCLPRFLPCTWRVSTMNVVVLMLLMLTGSRAAPTSGPPHFFSRARRNNPTDMLNSFRLPDNFTISGPCLATILSGLCNGFYFHTTTTNYDLGSDRFFCKGMMCRLETLTDYCDMRASHTRTIDFSGQSQPQRPVGELPESDNLNPFCYRYKDQINMKQVVREGGWSCGEKIDCLCGDCCSHQRKRQHQDLHPLLKLFLRMFPQKNLSHAKRTVKTVVRYDGLMVFLREQNYFMEEVLKMMMERKYTHLVRRLTNIAQQGRMFQDKQAIHPRHSPINFPLTTTETPCLHQPC